MKEVNAKNVAEWDRAGPWAGEVVADAATEGKITATEMDKTLKLPVRGQ